MTTQQPASGSTPAPETPETVFDEAIDAVLAIFTGAPRTAVPAPPRPAPDAA